MAELKSLLKDQPWLIQSSSIKSLPKKIKPDDKYLLLLPIWLEDVETIRSSVWATASQIEILLIRKSDEWQELSHQIIRELINTNNVRGVVDWPIQPAAFVRLVKKRIEEINDATMIPIVPGSLMYTSFR